MRSALLAIVFAAAGCGGNGLMENPDQSVAHDLAMAPADMTAIPDLAKPPVDMSNPNANADFSAVSCGASYCAKGQVCCVTPVDGGFNQTCAASCADGGITEMCDGPQQCDPNGKKYCCATVDVGAGNPPNCPFNWAMSMCTAQCNTMLAFQCPAMDTVRLCHVAADCADDPSNANCCDLRMGNQGVTGCVSDLVKGFLTMGGAKCYN